MPMQPKPQVPAVVFVIALLAILLAAAFLTRPAHAQVPMSRQHYAESVSCKRLADSVSFVVAKAQAGATDADIVAQMIAFNMRPLDDHLRQVAEENANGVSVNDVLQATYFNCMQGMGR